jgi:tRNA (guanine37-N1)-methyltransferase
MVISILSLFPDLYTPFLNTSLVARAREKKLVSLEVHNLFAYCKPKERIDSPTFGHGAGMLLRPDIIEKAVEDHQAQYGKAYKIFFSPHGKKLDQPMLKALAQIITEKKHVMLLPARYEGMDARVEEYYGDLILSIGDFVLMGGDLPAMVLIEGLLRLLPGVIGKQSSVEHESFSGPFVDYPEYTAPVVWKGLEVPEVLRSGNHAAIAAWRQDKAVERSILGHFDWVRSHIERKEDTRLVEKHLPAHYVVLMHTQVVLEEGREGTSSVTSLDIHDIARSARTFGIKKYFIVTPLLDQQKIVRKLLGFWQADVGIEYNPHRHEALGNVVLVSSLDEVLSIISQLEQKKPLLIGTGAKRREHRELITYNDQEKVWAHKRPVLFILGTARGLAPSLLESCDFLLEPIEGFSEFNHLSVRSAAAVIFDRWLGINPAARISLEELEKNELA